jgi:hypothetical protein
LFQQHRAHLAEEFVEDWKQKSMWVSASNMYVVLVYARICKLFLQFNFLPDRLPSFVLKITPSDKKLFVCNKNIAKLTVSLFEWMANSPTTIQCITFHRLFYARI